MIEIRSLAFHYPNQPDLFTGFDWRVADGEAWAVLGPSGCGKSTLLYLLAGLRLPVSGEVLVGGTTLTKPRPQTGLILQNYGLLPWATVEQNASLGLRLHRFYGPDGRHAPSDSQVEDVTKKVAYWLARVGLEDARGQFPGQISGGQRQRTAIARTLALDPDLLLMDEPFASLDAPTRQSLQTLVQGLRAEHLLTTVIVTHSIEEAALLGEHILVLGQAPNRDAVIVPNPQAAEPGYYQSHVYTERCAQLRQMLEVAA